MIIEASTSGEVKEVVSDDESEDENAVLKLFETCMDFMSLTSDFSIKAIRDSIKKVWNALSYVFEDNLHHEVIDAIISAVVGEDSVEDDIEHSEVEVGEKDETDKSVDTDEEEEEAEETETKINVSFPKKESTKEDDDQLEKDIFLNDEEAIEFLADSDNELDIDHVGMLQHSVEHDEAFAHMIEMRKQHRKQGLLQAKRNEMLIRSRAIDILEVPIKYVCD